MLNQQRAKKFAARWLAICALTLLSGWAWSATAFAQTDATDTTAPIHKSSRTKPAGTTPHATTSHPKPLAKNRSGSSTLARNSKSKRSSKKTSGKKIARGQQKIEPQRAEAIQEALIREHYLTGEPAGTWNQSSEDALRKYQADHGWQSKTVPDSRALISLGLGPSHDGLLNPESAMTTGPDVSHSASASSTSQLPISHSADPGPLNSGLPNTGLPIHADPVIPGDPAPSDARQ